MACKGCRGGKGHSGVWGYTIDVIFDIVDLRKSRRCWGYKMLLTLLDYRILLILLDCWVLDTADAARLWNAAVTLLSYWVLGTTQGC